MSLSASPNIAPAKRDTHHGSRFPAIALKLRGLRTLCAVARQGSVARAADEMCVSQASVTRAISDLEGACGLLLCHRERRGMMLSMIGASIASRTQLLFEHLARGAQEALEGAGSKPRREASPQRFAAVVSAGSLRAFVAVAISKSEARAAQELGLSQPTVHRALHELEDRLGIQLLARCSLGTALTEAGQALLQWTRLALAEARAIESELAAWQGQLRGHVIVGSTPLCTSALLTHAVQAMRRDRPEVRITLIEGPYELLMRQLCNAEIDVIVSALRESPVGVRQEEIYQEPLAVIASVGHPCLSIPMPTLADLQAWEWVLPLPGSPANQLSCAAHAACGLPPPRAAVHSNSATFTRSMLTGSRLLAMATYSQALQDEASGLFRRVPVLLPGSARPVGATTREIGRPSPDLLAVLDAMRAAAPAIHTHATLPPTPFAVPRTARGGRHQRASGSAAVMSS